MENRLNKPTETTENKSTPIEFLFNNISTVERLKDNDFYTLGDILNNPQKAIAVGKDEKINKLVGIK